MNMKEKANDLMTRHSLALFFTHFECCFGAAFHYCNTFFSSLLLHHSSAINCITPIKIHNFPWAGPQSPPCVLIGGATEHFLITIIF